MEAIVERWYTILGHSGDEAIQHLQQNVLRTVVTVSVTDTPTSYEPCTLERTHKIISRRFTQSEPAEKPLQCVAYDLIPMDIDYNDDKWVSHFYCFVTDMDFVYTHCRKAYVYDVIKEFLKMVKTRYDLVVRFIRTDGERTLDDRYTELTCKYDITIERSIPDTPKQNNVVEHSRKVIIRKVRCLRITVNLSTNL